MGRWHGITCNFAIMSMYTVIPPWAYGPFWDNCIHVHNIKIATIWPWWDNYAGVQAKNNPQGFPDYAELLCPRNVNNPHGFQYYIELLYQLHLNHCISRSSSDQHDFANTTGVIGTHYQRLCLSRTVLRRAPELKYRCNNVPFIGAARFHEGHRRDLDVILLITIMKGMYNLWGCSFATKGGGESSTYRSSGETLEGVEE